LLEANIRYGVLVKADEDKGLQYTKQSSHKGAHPLILSIIAGVTVGWGSDAGTIVVGLERARRLFLLSFAFYFCLISSLLALGSFLLKTKNTTQRETTAKAHLAPLRWQRIGTSRQNPHRHRHTSRDHADGRHG